MFKTVKSKRLTLEKISPLEWLYQEFSIESWKAIDIYNQYVTKSREQLVKSGKIEFRKVTEAEIIKQRFTNKSGIVMKKNNELYIAELPKGIRLSTLKGLLNKHKCRDCQHLSAKSDLCGGCAKVRDIAFRYMYGEEAPERRNDERLRDIVNSQRLEKYAFIEEGIETFNVYGLETFVIKCSHFERIIE